MGVKFDKIGDVYELALEGAHSHRRILHAGDATGYRDRAALAAKLLKEKLVDVRNFIYGKDLIIHKGQCVGAHAVDIQNNKEPHLPRQGHDTLHRRAGPGLPSQHKSKLCHRRRHSDGLPRRSGSDGHGIRPVPSHHSFSSRHR